MASIAVSSAHVAAVHYGVIGRSAMSSKYNNGPRPFPWRTPALTGESSLYCFNLYEELCVM
jgi:hypothetical protein